jgi:hypothetical protein
MSLINDALKRARQAQAQPVTAIGREPTLVPASSPTAGPKWLRPMIPFGAVALLFLAVWCFSLWWRQASDSAALAMASPAPEVLSAGTIAAEIGASSLMNAAVGPETPAPTSFENPGSGFGKREPSPPAFGSQVAPTGLTSVPAQPAAFLTAQSTPAVTHAPTTERLNPEEEADKLAPLKLQGIFYRMSDASALINGQTVFVGDEVDRAKVVRIERHTVSLVMDGRTNVLRLR